MREIYFTLPCSMSTSFIMFYNDSNVILTITFLENDRCNISFKCTRSMSYQKQQANRTAVDILETNQDQVDIRIGFMNTRSSPFRLRG
jgi:hypothetical protein